MPFSGEFKFEIVKRIATLSTEPSGWSKELNLVSYNGAAPKYDIRTWDPDHQKMGKGVTLSEEEVALLKEALDNLD
ncbi:MAG: YdbC family protein [Clostridia bacterium]|nr:YdbC family protein [Clostridia bacterium]